MIFKNCVLDFQEFDEVLQERRTSSSEEELAERIATNPLHAYKMMKRFNVDWKTLEQDLETHDWEEVEFMLKKKRLGTVIPREEDLHGAAQALIRLQDVYELDIRDLSKGTIFFFIFVKSLIIQHYFSDPFQTLFDIF